MRQSFPFFKARLGNSLSLVMNLHCQEIGFPQQPIDCSSAQNHLALILSLHLLLFLINFEPSHPIPQEYSNHSIHKASSIYVLTIIHTVYIIFIYPQASIVLCGSTLCFKKRNGLQGKQIGGTHTPTHPPALLRHE